MRAFEFEACQLPLEAQTLRQEVRDFLSQSLGHYTISEKAKSWVGFDANFSAELGKKGWLGMTWPKPFGSGRSSLERYVVIEELLAFGAPVAAHWIAERQSGPLILRFGTEEQKNLYLPGISKGESFFCIGMSEPGSGSDLASIITHAAKHADGWLLNGRKVWTTYAHKSHFMIALVRTSKTTEDRHAGLSQFIIDLSLPGITIRPIRNMIGDEEFNEVTFDNLLVDDSMLIGKEGNGWQQVVAELAFERSGPDRFLSSYILFREIIRILQIDMSDSAVKTIGRLTAQLITLRNMSLSVAAKIDSGKQPNIEASLVKDLGVAFEQSIPELAHELVDCSPRKLHGTEYQKSLAYVQQACVSFSLRGGTTEILRGMVARGLGLR
ncbi:MAG: acyl-CoA dehydrogenase family protein [Alphaproteobacteria bacterium]|nr:acyl-CoA dehydrogenase family protein [Alphaproteobacteria bacterium]